MVRNFRRKSLLLPAAALASLVVVASAYAGYTSMNPSYQGCTTTLFANAFPSGSDDVMYASHTDPGCATLVSARGKYIWAFGTYEAPWHRHGSFAQSTTYEPVGFDHGWGQGEIETGTNDWSQIFTTNYVFPY